MKKKILVTGASAGIGKATAVYLANKGHEVLMAARRKNVLEAIAKEHTTSGQLLFAELDVSKKESIDAFVLQYKDWLKDIDVLVNNAGLALGRESFEDSSFDDLNTMIQSNVTGLFELTRQTLKFMKARNEGHVVNLGSIAGIQAYKGGAVYCGTKAAVQIFTDALRHDFAGTALRFTNISPGRVATDFSKVRFKGDDERAKKVYEGFNPLKPEDIAECISWVTERPAHVNIQDIVVMCTEQPDATTIVPS